MHGLRASGDALQVVRQDALRWRPPRCRPRPSGGRPSPVKLGVPVWTWHEAPTLREAYLHVANQTEPESRSSESWWSVLHGTRTRLACGRGEAHSALIN